MSLKKILLAATLFVGCGDDSSSTPVSVSDIPEAISSSSQQNGNAQEQSSSSVAENKSSSSSAAAEIESDTEFTDPRDGAVYPIVDIEVQRWLNSNMNYASDSSWCYNDVDQNCDLLGRAYTWESAKQACPDGWRLPTSKDWNLLAKLNATDGVENKEKMNYVMTGHYSEENGEMSWNSSNKAAYFWDLEEVDADHAATFIFYLDGTSYLNDSVEKAGGSKKSDKQFVRCIRENKGTMTDPRDGQTYKTIRLGKNIWMQENLNFAADSSSEYVGDKKTVENPGRFYNHTAALTACPAGWHLPTADDFNSLIKLIKAHNIIDYFSLKSSSGWTDYKKQTSDDDFEFTALPVGTCMYSYATKGIACYSAGEKTVFWTGNKNVENGKFECAFVHSNPSVAFGCDSYEYNSVRCVKD